MKALPRVRDAATSKDLGHAGQTHYEETEFHVERLDQVVSRDKTPEFTGALATPFPAR